MISLRVILSRESPIGNEFDNCSRSKEKQLHPVAKNYLGNEFDNCSRKKQLHPKELFESFEFLIDSKGGGRMFLRYFIGEEEVLSANNTKIPFFPPSFRIGLFFPIVSLERRATEKWSVHRSLSRFVSINPTLVQSTTGRRRRNRMARCWIR